jgi:hypothetical protein
MSRVWSDRVGGRPHWISLAFRALVPYGRGTVGAANLPPVVSRCVTGEDGAIVDINEQVLDRGTGAATASLARVSLLVRSRDGGERRITLVRKSLRPLTTGRHAHGSEDRRHWAYWRREAEAYSSTLLPQGPGLRAPRCFGVVDNDIWLEEVSGPAPTVQDAAQHLALWQAGYHAQLDRPWMARDQLGRRLEVSHLDWGSVDADPRAIRLWEARSRYYEALVELPLVRSHGDYSLGNLVNQGADVVALDWATFGWEPLGFDLAHLGLASGQDPRSAYRASTSRWEEDAVAKGFASALAIIGPSRVHWMLSAGVEIPDWYVDFLCEYQPK